ncbi:Alpha-N-acetylgalactosaminidase [Nymphon striatum]|nr:Alpha-N-acetylgalactosaminidase [Nymphon striatum]
MRELHAECTEALSCDLVIEQTLMRSVKGTGGLTHGSKMTEEQRALWTMSAPIMSECNIAVQEFNDLAYTTSEQHKNLTGARIERDVSDLLKISAKMTSCSPFSSNPALRNIVNGIVAIDDVNVHEYDSVGKDIIVKMIGQPVFSFSFKRKDKAMTLGNSSGVKVSPDRTTDPSLLFQRFLVVSRTGDLSLEEVMRYELSPYPPSLFEDKNILRKADKPQLAQAIIAHCNKTPSCEAISDTIPQTEMYVLDGGALLHKHKWTRGDTYGKIAKAYADFTSKQYGSATVVFDGYLADMASKIALLAVTLSVITYVKFGQWIARTPRWDGYHGQDLDVQLIARHILTVVSIQLTLYELLINYLNIFLSEKLFLTMANLMAKEGFRELGYEYVNIDDCYLAKTRNAKGELQADPLRFPNGLPYLAKKIHELGLKFGVYEDYGTKTCGGYPGILGHLQKDAETIKSWGADMLKLDGCNVKISMMNKGYPEMGEYLNKTGRPILYSCSWPDYQRATGMKNINPGCLGKYLKGSGAKCILVESSVFGVNVVEAVLSRKHYVRSIKGMQLLKEALLRLQLEAFFKQCDLTKYADELKMKAKVADKNPQDSQSLLRQFQAHSDSLLTDFDQFIEENRSKNETFLYWDTFIHLMTLLENLIRSDREGNWALQVQSVQSLLPLFAAFDSTNYLRWCSLYLEDMHKLAETAPEVYKAFTEGKCVVKHTEGRFKAVGADMALEQTINKSQKGASGIIGSTRKIEFVAMWELIYHEMLAISSLHRELSGVKTSAYDSVVNHAFKKSETVMGERYVQAILAVIERNENPFQGGTVELKLHNILTQEVMTGEIRKQLLGVNEIGTAAYEKFRRERFVEKSVRLSSTIHRTNLKTFLSIKEKTNTKEKGGKALNTRKQSHQHRAIEIARARGKSMEDLLQYDVRTSSYLFDSEGMMKKAVKSSLVQELEKTLTKEDTGQTPSLTDNVQTAYIVDMMANVRKMRTKGMGTFGAFCEATFIYIQNAAKRANRIDLIFDSYIDKSIKDSERGRRQTVAPIELNMINQETPLPVEMERSHCKNVQIVASHVFGEQTILCLSAHNNCSTEVPELCLDIEEADARIIPHVLHAVQHGMRRIVVLSSDTDVSILLIYYWATFLSNGLQELWVKAGVGDSTRFIPIHTLASRLGSALCHVLPAVHMLTGCDYTSKVGTKQAALNNHPETYLKGFGTCANVQDMDLVIIRAEEYLVHVLKKGTAFTTMNQLRTHTYHQSKGAYLDKLPPTSYAIKAHIRRAFYGTHQMTTILSSKRHTLDATQYGYEEDDDMLMPAMAIREIPEEYTLQCNCQKCGTIRCVCRQKWPNYTEIGNVCNIWRVYNDISFSWKSVASIIDYFGDNQDALAPHAGPGQWNDPDMASFLGNPGLSYDQSKAQMAIWSILAAPLLMSNDLRKLAPEFKAILQNKKIIAVDQDPLGIQGRRFNKTKDVEIWSRQITPKKNKEFSYAIAVLYRGTEKKSTTVNLEFVTLGLSSTDGYRVQDLYTNKDFGIVKPNDTIFVDVNSTGVVMLKATVV